MKDQIQTNQASVGVILPGFQLGEVCFRAPKHTLYRGKRDRDELPVLIKVANWFDTDSTAEASTTWEYDASKELTIEGIVPVLDLVPFRKGSALVLKDVGCLPLESFLSDATLTTEVALDISCKLAKILGRLQAYGIVHKTIRPENILVDLDTKSAWLTGLGSVARPKGDIVDKNHLHAPNDLLAYLAPEQTGRMNRQVDYRSDLYSLGATMYAMFTGEVPFIAADRLELVHSLVARQPVAPCLKDPNIPRGISDVIMKLMAKAAEDRYQSAKGLIFDLELCRNIASGSSFMPGSQDYTDQFLIPQKLYGRKDDLEILLQAFDRTCNGASEMFFVAGYSGVGKSALVDEIHRPVVEKRGYFVSGKFDQFNRDIPYSALISAFQDLTSQLLAESDEDVARWSENILAAVGQNGQVIIDVVPEIELIVGKQPPLIKLPPTETKNRFNLIFERFLKVFTQKSHPLVLFLDDLQWADLPTLRLLQSLSTDPALKYLLIIGAYRDNEVGASHPLTHTLTHLKSAGATVQSVTLKPLTKKHIVQFVTDILKRSPSEVESLAQIVKEKTNGNPFFVIQFLKVLLSEEILKFDDERGGWNYDETRIPDLDITDNVVDLMTRKIKKLSDSAQGVVKLAACIGSTFDLGTLSIVNESSPEKTAVDMEEAQREGLLVPTSEVAENISEIVLSCTMQQAHQARFRFLHDRIQQAAYALIPNEEKAIVRLRVGRLLLSSCDESQLDEHLFDIVGHLNMGSSLITSSEELERLARLNLQAGYKAKKSTAYRPALNYFSEGVARLPADAFESLYDLAFALHLEQAECNYLCGHFDVAQEALDDLLNHAKSPLEQAEIYRIRIVQYENTNRFPEARDWGKLGLSLFNIEFPDDEDERQDMLKDENERINLLLGSRTIDDLVNLPVMTDDAMRMSMKLLMTMWAPSYISGDMTLTVLIATKMVHLSLRYGNVEESAYGYVTYGATVGLRTGNYSASYAFGRLALSVNEHFEDLSARAKVNHMFSCYICPWQEPIESCFTYSREAHLAGLSSGDFIYSAYGVYHESWHALFRGQQLAEYYDHYSPYLEFIARTQNQTFVYAHKQVLQLSLALQGRTKYPVSFDDSEFDESIFLQDYEHLDFFRSIYFITKLQLLYILGEVDEAESMAIEAERVAVKTEGMIWDAWRCFYQALVLAAQYPSFYDEKKKATGRKLELLRGQLEIWSGTCPENFEAKYQLVKAECASLDGRREEAAAAYKHAIDSATERGFVHIAAIANECFGRFWLQQNDSENASLYLSDSCLCYRRWGATAKVNQLKKVYPHLLTSSRDGNNVNDSAVSRELDLSTVAKAARVISGEIEQRKVLDRLMKIVMENAGADRGFLLMDRDGHFVVESSATARDQEYDLQVDDAQDWSKYLSTAIVQYVAHVGNSTVVSDASSDPRFENDPYIQKFEPRSILCTTILHHGTTIGILYLENTLTRDAFTADRLEVVQILASQAAISLENARLYEEMKLEIAERKKIEEALRKVEEATAPVTGADYFHSLVKHLSTAFGVRYAFISQCVDAGNTSVQTLAYWKGSGFGNNFNYSLDGTPCKDVIDGELSYYAEQVQMLFPDDNYLQKIGAESYLGIPLRSASGNVVGHLAVFDDKPMNRNPHDLSVLKIFAARAGAELERNRAEQELQRAYDELEVRVEERTEALSVANLHLQREIEERENTEIKLQDAKEAAESANRAKSEFLANMSHELRTPLNGILGYAQILERDAGLTESQRKGLSIVQRSGKHLLMLINDILDLSKIEAGKIDAQEIEFPLQEFLRDIAEIGRIRAEQKGLAFLFAPFTELPGIVKGDERRLRQILLNLLSNAAKFTDSGGVALRVGVNKSSGKSRMHFVVEDSGIGIHPEDLTDIFQPFYQIRGPGRFDEGTGLGLAISQKLVNLMGGTLHVESTPGSGSTFWIAVDLPEVAPVHVIPRSSTSIVGYKGPKKKVLIVDDKAENRSLLVDMLEPLGFKTTEAKDGSEALDKAKAFGPDIVLMDLVMPVMDGFEAARQFRAIPEYKNTKIIALSASVFEHSKLESREAGCHDFIPKPIDADVFLQSLQKNLQIEWIYSGELQPRYTGNPGRVENEPDPILKAPEQEILRTLNELALSGDIQGILRRLEAVESMGDQYEPFVKTLRRMADDYDMKRINDLIEPFLDDRHE